MRVHYVNGNQKKYATVNIKHILKQAELTEEDYYEGDGPGKYQFLDDILEADRESTSLI